MVLPIPNGNKEIISGNSIHNLHNKIIPYWPIFRFSSQHSY